MRKCYIAGKITGEPNFAQLFDNAVKEVTALGYIPVNPLGLPHNHARTWSDFMREDLTEMLKCHAIFILTNHITSKGATIELFVATHLGLNVIYQR